MAHTKEGKSIMDLLKIDESNEAYFLKNGERVPITEIERDDLVELVAVASSNEKVSMDECTEKNDIVNPIAKTIYVHIYSTLKDLSDNRETYLHKAKEDIEALKKEYGLA